MVRQSNGATFFKKNLVQLHVALTVHTFLNKMFYNKGTEL